MNTAQLRSQCLAQTAYSFGDGPPREPAGAKKPLLVGEQWVYAVSRTQNAYAV